MKEFALERAGSIKEKTSISEVKNMILAPSVSLVTDFDETIAKTARLQRISYTNAVREALNIDFEITEEFGRTQLRGKTGYEICRILFRHFGNIEDEGLVVGTVALRNNVLERLAITEEDLTKYLIPGVDDMVRVLRKTGKKAGIASQSPDGFIHTFLQRVVVDGKSIIDVFEESAIIGGTTIRQQEVLSGVPVSSLNKPDPFSIFLAAGRIRQGEGDHTLYIGDHNVDAECVRGQQNMTGLIVNENEGKRAELSGVYGLQKNIVIVRSLSEVLHE